MRTAEASIIINAEPWEVWDVLTKVYEYDNWSPSYKYIKGTVELDAYVDIEYVVDLPLIAEYMPEPEADMFIDGPIKPAKKYRYKIISLVENHHLEWQSKMLGGLMVNQKQSFRLEASGDNKTLFINKQTLSGFVPGLMPDNVFKAYFTALNTVFNERLKDYVEENKSTEML